MTMEKYFGFLDRLRSSGVIAYAGPKLHLDRW